MPPRHILLIQPNYILPTHTKGIFTKFYYSLTTLPTFYNYLLQQSKLDQLTQNHNLV